jgi:predicted enzyme related to lactoylglutathione lyase
MALYATKVFGKSLTASRDNCRNALETVLLYTEVVTEGINERDGYQPGVPCWVDTFQPDPDSALSFYAELFGWKVDSRMSSDSLRKYFVCTLRGRDVAAIGSQPSKDIPPDWNTYVWVDSIDDVAAKATEEGGSVVLEPFESLGGGRAVMLADPAVDRGEAKTVAAQPPIVCATWEAVA